MVELLSFEDAGKVFAEQMAAGLSTQMPDGLDPQKSLRDMIRAIFGLEPAKHHMEWIEALEDEDNYPRLLIISPPGHAKTTVAGVAYPAWKIANDNQLHFLYYGNTGMQAVKQSVAIRDIIISEKMRAIWPRIKPNRTKGWAGNQWFLEREHLWDKDPTMLALGVDGPSLGARADEFIFDDVCDMENQATEYNRNKVRGKVNAVAFSRQTGKSRSRNRMVAVMTKWHDDDLATFFEEQGFKTIWMPAEGYWTVVRPRTFGRTDFRMSELTSAEWKEDLAKLDAAAPHLEPLWDTEYDQDYFDTWKKTSPDIWNLEFQGVTVRAGGNLFSQDDFRLWGDENPALPQPKVLNPMSIRGVFQYWDTASKAKSDSDYWVCQTWAWASDGFYLLQCYVNKFEFPAGVEMMKAKRNEEFWLYPMDGGEPLLFSSRMMYIETTGTNNGEAAIQTLTLQRIPCLPTAANISKEERAGQAVSVMHEKPVYVPADESRYIGTSFEAFIAQHLGFPRVKHDDIVDVTSQALTDLDKYPISAKTDWRSEGMGANSKLRKDAVRTGPTLITRTGGSRARIVRGGFGSARARRPR